MKLAEIPGGFALYKEKTAVGRCEVTATAQGAALTLLTIVPEWRRKGYGSYLLKEVLRRFGGYDKETATVFTAPLPGDEGERAFWEKFGFRAEGAQLCRRRTPDLTAVKFVQDFLTSRLAEPKLLVDATCGNGGDTAFLCRLAGKGGRVLGFDIQPEAIASTERNLAAKGLSAELHCDSHANLLQYVTPGTADAVMFNFGWLPGADHNVFSHASSSIPALEAALDPELDARTAPQPLHRPRVRLRQLGRNRPAALLCAEKMRKVLHYHAFSDKIEYVCAKANSFRHRCAMPPPSRREAFAFPQRERLSLRGSCRANARLKEFYPYRRIYYL